MARNAWFMTLAAAAVSLPFSPGQAAEPPQSCAPRSEIVQALAAENKEQPVAVGTADHGMRVEVFANADGAWTLLVTLPNGISCLMNGGTDWQLVPRVAAVSE
jgi:hypothetical protein